MSVPTFAVVGHPNKGKSSIVSTLARDDSVRVAPEPGTTIRCRYFPMEIDRRVLYQLVDTPGFQRARQAMAWMKQHETTAAGHRGIVRAFVDAHRGQDRFVDECQLLTPLLEGAGILYVVDGSVPYGPEYESEMEILRWSGQPRLALINPIRETDHIEEWRRALGQYFNVVRVFDALDADFTKQIELLRAFGQIEEPWQPGLNQAVEILIADRRAKQHRAAREIVAMLRDIVTLSVSRDLADENDAEVSKPSLIEKYKQKMRDREQTCRNRVQSIYDHHSIDREEPAFEILEQDLFAMKSWYLWGLSRSQLMVTGIASGALAGGVLDSMLGGTSFLAGTAIGAVSGGAAAWLGAGRLAKFEVMRMRLGGARLQFGPSKNVNLPFVILGRAMYHHELVANRTHAQRGPLTMTAMEERTIDTARLKKFGSLFEKLRKGDDVNDMLTDDINDLLAKTDEVTDL